MKKTKILFTGGGTGGHIFPLIAVARELMRFYRPGTLQLYFIGPNDDFVNLLLSTEEIKVKTILSGKIRRYFSLQAFFSNIIDAVFKIPFGTIQALFQIMLWQPNIIYSKGGYGSIPVILAGWFLGVPIFIHESDISPGFANRFAGRFAKEIFISFPKTEYFPASKIMLVGNPIRREVLQGSKEEATKIFKLSNEKPVILILGGSQGAQRINDMLFQILTEILMEFELIHQCGEKNFKQVWAEAKVVTKQEYAKYYHVIPFLRENELRHAYQAADLIVSRGGSASIAEIAALGKPSIFIPLPESAQNHQVKNVTSFAESGATVVIEEENLTPRFFLERLRFLFSHREKLDEMARKAKEFSMPDAANIIAEYLADYLAIHLKTSRQVPVDK